VVEDAVVGLGDWVRGFELRIVELDGEMKREKRKGKIDVPAS
jgi:hypothetical protein